MDKTLATFDNETLFIFGHAFDPEEEVTGNKEDLKAMQKIILPRMLQFVEGEIRSGKSKGNFKGYLNSRC
ncbi:MAG: hypothetical protein WKF59_11340 [Chitinophagaceae bacterium]